MTVPAEGPAANPVRESMGKEDEHVFDGLFPDAVTFDAVSWLVWLCTAEAVSHCALKIKLEKDSEWSVQRIETW